MHLGRVLSGTLNFTNSPERGCLAFKDLNKLVGAWGDFPGGAGGAFGIKTYGVDKFSRSLTSVFLLFKNSL